MKAVLSFLGLAAFLLGPLVPVHAGPGCSEHQAAVEAPAAAAAVAAEAPKAAGCLPDGGCCQGNGDCPLAAAEAQAAADGSEPACPCAKAKQQKAM